MKIIPAAQNRVFVNNPLDWAYAIGTDYLARFSTMTDLNAGGTAGTLLSGRGWTTTTTTFLTPSAGDFFSSADLGTPNGIDLKDTTDALITPIVFGNYDDRVAVSYILGYLPTTINFELYGAFTVSSANETVSGFGLLEDTGAVNTANDAFAFIFSDGTNFKLRSGAATSAAGPAVDTAYHKWRIELTSSIVNWYIDDVIQPTLALQADEFPVKFAAYSGTTNRTAISSMHFYYR